MMNSIIFPTGFYIAFVLNVYALLHTSTFTGSYKGEEPINKVNSFFKHHGPGSWFIWLFWVSTLGGLAIKYFGVWDDFISDLHTAACVEVFTFILWVNVQRMCSQCPGKCDACICMHFRRRNIFDKLIIFFINRRKK